MVDAYIGLRKVRQAVDFDRINYDKMWLSATELATEEMTSMHMSAVHDVFEVSYGVTEATNYVELAVVTKVPIYVHTTSG